MIHAKEAFEIASKARKVKSDAELDRIIKAIHNAAAEGYMSAYYYPEDNRKMIDENLNTLIEEEFEVKVDATAGGWEYLIKWGE